MLKKSGTILAFALVGWALCGAVMGVGMAVASVKTALAVHAVAAPIIFAGLSWAYFRWFGYTTPLQTAVVFVAVVILMDFFVVSLLILKSFDMFGSVVGTWLTFLLIFASTLATGELYCKGG